MRPSVLILVAVIGIVLPSYGEMYKWVGEKGTIHFAEDLFNVPERYRQGVEKRSTSTESPPSGVKGITTLSPAVPKPTDSEGVEINLILKHELLLTEVVLNGRVRRHFILDSGASFTLINRQTASELGLAIDESTPFIPVSTVSGVILTPLVTLRSVQVGKVELENVEALIYTMPSENEGLLGNSFLNKFRVVIDNINGKLILHGGQVIHSPDRPGGYGRDYWVGQFRFYHRNLENLNKLKAKMEAQGSRAELNRVNNAIRYFEDHLNDLERKASSVGVPRSWRE